MDRVPRGEDEHSLRSQLDELLARHRLNLKKISELSEQIALCEARRSEVDASLAKSERIALSIEESARVRVKDILDRTQVYVDSQKAVMAEMDRNIAALRQEWEDLQVSAEARVKALQQLRGTPMARPVTALPSSSHLPGVEPGASPYSIKIVSFVNARHSVNLGGNPGSLHAHSWQLELEVAIPEDSNETVEFSRIFSLVNEVLSRYENTILNQIPPFTVIQPTTENVAMYFFNRLADAVAGMGLGLAALTLWETPTRGVQVNSRNPEIDGLIQQRAGTGDRIPYDDQTEAGTLSADGQRSLLTKRGPPRQISMPLYGPYPLSKYLLAAAIIIAVTLLAYHQVLWPPLQRPYPWGSDTWGHLARAEYLYDQIKAGNYQPQFYEYYYNGGQPLRYGAPLPYYVLALLRALSGNIIVAGNIYVVLFALLGGMSWLFLSRRMGLLPAALAGVVWVVWVDNVRVALSEGNLPRVLATALLPLLVAAFVNLLDEKRRPGCIIAVFICTHLAILCHPMIGMACGVSLWLFALLTWCFAGCRLRQVLEAAAVLLLGIGSAGWWLLPALTGGPNAISLDTARAALLFVPAAVSFDPLYRFSNREVFYWGTSLLAALMVTVAAWKAKPPWARSMAVCGAVLIVITFPVAKAIYTLLPLSHLMWPLRFSSFGALACLASSLTFNPPADRQSWLKSTGAAGVVMLCLFGVLLVDCWASLPLLAATRGTPPSVNQTTNLIKDEAGWRVAAIDLSLPGSPPSYSCSEFFGKEQAFGWVWQGAVSSPDITLINTGIENVHYPFLFESCVNLGATDLVVKDDAIDDAEAFAAAAMTAGYKRLSVANGISTWHSVDYPYLVQTTPKCLVIGQYSDTIALQFPQVEMGTVYDVDKYALSDLKRYDTVILSGARWRSREAAERVIRSYVKAGGNVIIDLSGMPENVLAKQPEFLGVYGETISLKGKVDVRGEDSTYPLELGGEQEGLWKAYVPMGLDQVVLSFSYYGNQAPIMGYMLVEGRKVWFLGGNIIYHALRNSDPTAHRLAREMLFGQQETYNRGTLIPVSHYAASENGYRLRYSADHTFGAIIPVVAMKGMEVSVDGRRWTARTYENLLYADLPAGTHTVTISLSKTPEQSYGLVVSALALIVLLTMILLKKRALA